MSVDENEGKSRVEPKEIMKDCHILPDVSEGYGRSMGVR